MISSLLPIETPEGISFSYEPASLIERGKAYLIDLLIRVGLLLVIGLVFVLLLGSAALAGLGIWMILAFLVEWGYYVLFEMVWDGQSPGKRLFDLRVIRSAGDPIGFYESVLRNLLRAADVLPLTLLGFFDARDWRDIVYAVLGAYAVGALAMLVSRRFQRLGDIAAGTIVVQERRAWFGSAPRPGAAAAATAPDLRRLTLSNQERRLLQEFEARKDRLHPERREELAQILASAYARRFGLPVVAGDASGLLGRLHRAASEEAKP